MQWLALREAWWPMAVAVAWVFLRSRQVVEQLLDRHPRQPITFATVANYAAALTAGGEHTTPDEENTEAAFRNLRHPLETGEIEIVGTPFVRISDLQGSSRLEIENQRTIPYTEVSSLVPYNDHGELCLIPRDWRAAHGSARTNLRGYRNPLVRCAALVRAFPEERIQLTRLLADVVIPGAPVETIAALEQSSPDAGQSGNTGSASPSRKRRQKHPKPVQQAVIEAATRLWPDGKMPAIAKQRDAELAQEVKKTSGIAVSGSTIRRALSVRQQKRKLRSR